MAIVIFLVTLFVAPAIGQGVNQPARITGRVLAAETGLPVRGAVVELGTQVLVTDADGRFEFSEKRVGTYQLRASKAGYVPNIFGGQADPANQVDVIAGKRVDRGDIRLQRASVISGLVADESGEPIADAHVVAFRIEFPQPGIRSWQAIKEVPTNDLGEYRIHGLMPGQYYVSAGRSPIRPDLSLPGMPQSMFVSAQGPLASARPRSEPILVDTVYGGETGGMNLTLRRPREARISGSVVDSSGRPAVFATVTLSLGQYPVSPLDSGGGQTIAKAGDFVFTNVPMGEYRLTATVDVMKEPQMPARGGGSSAPVRVHESASMSINVTGDVSSLTVHTTQTKPAPDIRGRVFIDGVPAETATRLRLVILQAGQLNPTVSRATAAGTIMSTFLGGRPTPGGRFIIPVNAGVIVLRHEGAPELTLKSVLAFGVDVTDGFEVTPTAGGMTLDVHLTTQGPVLQGVVKDGDGGVAAGSDVVLFSVDPASWKVPLTRRVATVRAGENGAFQVSGLPPGQYLAVAPGNLDRAMWADPDRLERLRAFATPFSLTEGASTQVALQIKR